MLFSTSDIVSSCEELLAAAENYLAKPIEHLVRISPIVVHARRHVEYVKSHPDTIDVDRFVEMMDQLQYYREQSRDWTR